MVTRGCHQRSFLGGRLTVPDFRPLFPVLAVTLAGLLGGMNDAHAFFTTLKYETAELGKREILSFNVPAGYARPRLQLLRPRLLQVTVPGLLALPAAALDTERSRWIRSFHVEEIPGGDLGLHITIGLKSANLNFRDSLGAYDPIKGAVYSLEIDQPEIPTGVGKAKLLEGRTWAGRDGTLLILSHTGNGFVEHAVDMSQRIVQLYWRSAEIDPGWRRVEPGGLVEKVWAQPFSGDRVEFEISLHQAAESVRFHRNSQAGLFIVEINTEHGLGRIDDVEETIRRRLEAVEAGQPMPLNRLEPVFVYRPGSEMIMDGQEVSEASFLKNAKEAERDHRFAKARAYLDSLLLLYPDTPNREIVDFYKFELARKMDWKPGWLLRELEAAVARHPNSLDYPRYRLLQLSLYNLATQYDAAKAVMNDFNLPKDDNKVWLEQGRTSMGLARSKVDEKANWKAAEEYLRRVVTNTGNRGDFASEAVQLLARLAQQRGDGEEAVSILDDMTREQKVHIALKPEWLMEVADTYYRNHHYAKAFQHYVQFLSNYPTLESIAPWALLRAGESSRQMGRIKEATLLFGRLQNEYPESDSAVWGRIFQLRLEKDQEVEKRLVRLDKVIDDIALPDALAEALVTKSELLGEAKRYRKALDTLNHLLSLTSRRAVLDRAEELKRQYLRDGMRLALTNERPEYAALLAEAHGVDWRFEPGFEVPRMLLAEALLRMGLRKEALPLLAGLPDPAAPGLAYVASTLEMGGWPGVNDRPADAGEVTPEETRVRLDEAERLLEKKEWEGILILLEKLPGHVLSEKNKARQLRLLAKAEVGRGRFPQAVRNLEDLLFGKPLGEGNDYYWYATVLQMWKGGKKALPAFQHVAKEAKNKEIQALAHIRIGDIMQRAGDFAASRDEYRAAAKLMPGTSWAKVSKENASQLEMAMEVAQ